MNKKLSKPRFNQQAYARAFGYFWLPCPICGKMFGGHETADGGFLMDSWNGGQCVCSECNDEAHRRNELWMRNNPHPGVEV
jgi:hypothetical protein